ncbi:MAG: hypothetical protein AAFX06_20850 [Planctomycetota bacterium]
MRKRTPPMKRAFTILEVLIALTASLLLMLGLARTYKLLGNKISERQSELDLSSRLRDVAIRLRDEIRRATCEMSPPASEAADEGYLVYHEGPFTDTTGILGSVPHPAPRAATYLPDSRYGDIDDFLAFTSRAQDGAPFQGFIPRGVIDAVRLANGQLTIAERTNYNTIPNYGSVLVPFYSDVAEIAYWLSPQWDREATGALAYENDIPDGAGNFSLYPTYRDLDGDYLPDSMTLHRRVLLVRPDLNMTRAQMRQFNLLLDASNVNPPIPAVAALDDVPQIPFLQGRGAGSAVQIVGITELSGANRIPGFLTLAPGIWRTGGAADTTASPHWMTGVARLQQVMDLSISRVTDDWTAPAAAIGTVSNYGMPTAFVQANSLSGLTRPENRFAHVRIPQYLLTGPTAGPFGSTMPQLALCPPHRYLEARVTSPPALSDPNDPLLADPPNTNPTTFPRQADHTHTLPPPGGNPNYNAFGRFTMTTFLRPEFNLSDRVSDGGAGGTSIYSVNRAGSDVIATDVLGFDIQVFDPDAPQFVWYGPDGVPGAPGDDDGFTAVNDLGAGAGTDDDADGELGWPGTDDEYVSVNDPRLDEVLVNNGNRQQNDWFVTGGVTPFKVTGRGDFVDIGYPHLAGGPMRGLIQFHEDGAVICNVPTIGAANESAFDSPFSGFTPDGTALDTTGTPPPLRSTFQPSWERSGRFVVATAAGSNAISSFFQPVYDTWTDGYLADGFDQEGEGLDGLNAATSTANSFDVDIAGVTTGTSYTERRVAQNNGTTVVAAGRPVVLRRWTAFDGAFASEGRFVGQTAGDSQIIEPESANPIELSPPITQPLQAIKITIRVNDLPAATVRQQTVVQEF